MASMSLDIIRQVVGILATRRQIMLVIGHFMLVYETCKHRVYDQYEMANANMNGHFIFANHLYVANILE